MSYRLKKVGDVIEEIAMGPFGSNIKIDCFVPKGVPVLNGSNLTGFTLSEDSFNYVTYEKAVSLKKAVASRGDIVITHRGTLGQIVYIPANSKYDRYVISQSQFRVRCKKNEMLPEFMVYFFHSREGQHKLLSNSSQVGVPALARPSSTFQELEIPAPSLEEQQTIAETLIALDDKIANNTKINHHLEQIAQAIFKSWFVDFEPFADGEFVFNESNSFPKGWTLQPLYDFADYINGAAFKKEEYAPTGTPIVKIAELKNGITNSTQYCGIKKAEKYYIDNKELLFSWSGNPETSIDTFIWHNGFAILNQHTFKVEPRAASFSFVYCLLRYLKPEFTKIASNKQTTGLGHVTVADLKRLLFPYKTEVIVEFCKILDPIIDSIYVNLLDNRSLAILRDTLLPRLMSGELSIADIGDAK